ncbi:MAG: tRNA (adenosine(37)-N6)-dimethylallyltransferase MiaA [Patescibacteria group bacterium]
MSVSIDKAKLLIICGPTGVGKTALGIDLAKKFNGEIVSADSRQIYKGLNIATGKDIGGGNRKKLPYKEEGIEYYWELENIPIYLLDAADPEENFSVAQYYQLATRAIDYIRSVKKLPIIVGGTGLYIKSLIENMETLGIPPNQSLRLAYEGKSANELFMILSRLNPELANSLNESEKNNKQRLIRRIEVAQSTPQPTPDPSPTTHNSQLTLQISLTAPYPILKEKIAKRIDEWVKMGAVEEINSLLKNGISWGNQSMSSLGYKEWEPYFKGKKTKEETIKEWKTKEWQYAKRQLIWFKKDPNVMWFDITDKNYPQNVEETVKNWYNSNDAKND